MTRSSGWALASLLLVLAAGTSSAEPTKPHVERYASRIFLADGRVVDAVGTRTLSIPSADVSDIVSLRMPSGRILQASSRSESAWDSFEIRLSWGDVSLTMRGTLGFAKDKLPDGLMLRLKDSTLRWIVRADLPQGSMDGADARKKMQAAVAKLPQDFLSDVSLFASLCGEGLDLSVFNASHFYILLSELFPEQPAPVNVTTAQPLEPEVAEKLLEGK